LLAVGSVLVLFGFSAMQKRAGRAPIPTSVVIGVTLFLLGTVIAAVAGSTGDIVGAVLGVILVVVGLMLASRSAQAMQRGRQRLPQQAQPTTFPFPPAPTSPQPGLAPYPPGVEGVPSPPPPLAPQYPPPPPPVHPTPSPVASGRAILPVLWTGK